MMIFCALLLSVCLTRSAAALEEVPLGLIVSDWSEYGGVFSSINIALSNEHNNRTKNTFQFKLWADRIKTVDAFKLSKIVCRQVGLKEGYKYGEFSDPAGPMYH